MSNVTGFGAFIDIGVGVDGLLHISEMKTACNQICTGGRVTVRIKSIDLARKRISLQLSN